MQSLSPGAIRIWMGCGEIMLALKAPYYEPIIAYPSPWCGSTNGAVTSDVSCWITMIFCFHRKKCQPDKRQDCPSARAGILYCRVISKPMHRATPIANW